MVAIMVATVMQVVYTSMVTVALPTIQGEMSATPDQGSWLLTSFLVTSAIFMPLTGFFTDRLGMKRFMLLSIIGFGTFTVMCGLATSFAQLVVIRALQGVFGAAMVPLSQAVIPHITPIEEGGNPRVDTRLIIGTGILLGATGSYFMTWYSLDIDGYWIIWPMLVQGFGLGMISTPLFTVAYATLPREQQPEAAGVNSLVRTIGSSIAITTTIALFTRMTQINWNQLGGNITLFNPDFAAYLQPLQLAPNDPRAIAVAAGVVGIQSAVIGLVDTLKFVTLAFYAMLPLVFLIKRPK